MNIPQRFSQREARLAEHSMLLEDHITSLQYFIGKEIHDSGIAPNELIAVCVEINDPLWSDIAGLLLPFVDFGGTDLSKKNQAHIVSAVVSHDLFLTPEMEEILGDQLFSIRVPSSHIKALVFANRQISIRTIEIGNHRPS